MTRRLLTAALALALPALVARVSCGRVEVVKRFKPRRNGRFRVTLSGAETRQVATFRFRTPLRFSQSDPKLYRRFTLPQYVDIG